MNASNKILLSASAGGHLSQMLRIKDAWSTQSNCVYVSSVEALREKLQQYGKVHIVGECNREHPINTFLVMLNCLKVVIKEHPSVVISTGAAPGLLCCLWAKLLFRSKIVWLDSIANTEKLSMSGRIVRPFANLILSQWPDVAAKYNNVEYVGAVI